MSFSTRRLWTWLPPAFFFVLSLIVFAAMPGGGSKIFYGVLTVLTGYWLWRSRRVGVELTDDALVVRGQIRDHHLPWTEVRKATAAPMRTMSPLQHVVPYVALTLELADGRVRQFEEVSAAARNPAVVEQVTESINSRLR